MKDQQHQFEQQHEKEWSFIEKSPYHAYESDKIYPVQRKKRITVAMIVRILLFIPLIYYTLFFLLNFERASYGIGGWILLIALWFCFIFINIIINLTIKLRQTKETGASNVE